MTVNPSDMISLLQREYLFQEFSKEQVAWISSKFTARTLPKGSVIFQQGQAGEVFYVVYKGKVRVSYKARQQEREITILKAGDFFGEEALLFNRPRSATLTTVESSVLLQMERTGFEEVLAAYPQIKERLLATAESRRLARSHDFNFLGDTEVIYFISRRHIIFLFRALLLSLLGVLLALVFLGVGLDLYLRAEGSLSATITVALGLVFLAGAVLWALWSFEDWRNDYYVVTSQRVLWLEKVIGLYDSRREAPLDQVQSVNVNTTQIGRIFGYGNVNVRTFTGGILMRRANQPTKLASFVEGFRARAQILSREEEAKAMEEALDEALTKSMLRLEGKDVQIPDEPPPMKEKKEPEKKPVSFREKLRNFLKVRYEEEDKIITYRKHLFVLFKKTWLPLAFILLLAAATTVLAEIQIVQRVRIISGLPALVLDTLLFLGLFIWFGYEYADWSNDIYRLTKDQIFDIERKPLGRELKKTAQIKDILSIEHERKNLIGVMLNYGDVNIKVGETIFDFIGVYNPDQVHQDISDYRENLLRAQRKRERAEEQKQMVNWLVAFYHRAEGLRGSQDEAIELEWGADFGDKPDWDEFSG